MNIKYFFGRALEVLEHFKEHVVVTAKWLLFAVVSGLVIGLVGTGFFMATRWAAQTRADLPWLIYFLPLGGVIIVWLYRMLHDENSTGTNLVLSAIHSGEEIPLKMAPLIFISTVITHLLGGSAGREGAALQLGGSIGNELGRLFKFDQKDQHIMIMCGMSAAFSALFGTPLAASIFSMEVVSVGIMHYAALVPCVVAALIAQKVALYFGATYEVFAIPEIPEFNLVTAIIIGGFALLCALVCIFFVICLHQGEKFYHHFFKNRYVRIVVGGVIIILLTLLVGDQTYNGTGINYIAKFMEGEVIPPAFLLKIIFTALTLGAGFKGGEIVPTFFIGASFGVLFGQAIGFSPVLCAAVGMGAVFCGVTNCPISSLLICFEMFGFEGMPYYLLSIALCYVLSGYYGLYSSQKIVYSKYKTTFVNHQTHQ
ncbi:MAG: chloride channel protein [Lachnospiraceae bacterium]|nr:chloride channel protein [Lachnospiraceae bacterium]